MIAVDQLAKNLYQEIWKLDLYLWAVLFCYRWVCDRINGMAWSRFVLCLCTKKRERCSTLFWFNSNPGNIFCDSSIFIQTNKLKLLCYIWFFLLKHLFNYMHIEYTFILKTDLSSHQITTNVVQYSFHHDINVSRGWVVFMYFDPCSSWGLSEIKIKCSSLLFLNIDMVCVCWMFHFQEECLQKLQSRIDVPYDSSIPEHQVSFLLKYFKSNWCELQCDNNYEVRQRL
jgi:hypothetical protein